MVKARTVFIHYAPGNLAPDPKWRDREGTVICRGRGPGPRNGLVKTKIGLVVVPAGNVRKKKEGRD